MLTLVEDDAPVTEIVQATRLSQPLVSQHLRTLRDLCPVRVQRTGREDQCSVDEAHVMSVVRDVLTRAIEGGLTR